MNLDINVKTTPPNAAEVLVAWLPGVMLAAFGMFAIETKLYVEYHSLIFIIYLSLFLIIGVLCFKTIPQQKKATKWAKVVLCLPIIFALAGLFGPKDSARIILVLTTVFSPFSAAIISFIKLKKI